MERLDIAGNDVIIVYEKLPKEIKGWTCPKSWGYLVIIDERMSLSEKFMQLLHEVRHISNHDFYSEKSVEEIESDMEYSLSDPNLLLTVKKAILDTYNLG